MQRSKYDPPEYRDWVLERPALKRFEDALRAHPERAARSAALASDDLLRLYAGMVRFRLFDTMLKRWVRQGVLSKAWLGTGEEAVSVGAARALRQGDVIGPMIRNAGACFEVGMSMVDHFAGYLGTIDSGSQGRDLHVGDLAHGVVAPISHVGSLLPVMCGLALAFKRRREPRVALTWVGDGASRTGEIHEAVNFAAVARLPIVIILQNNQVALGTRTTQESVVPYEEWARGYGLTTGTVDGNHVLDVLAATTVAVERCRQGEGPVALVAETFRMGGHATHDESEARRLFDAETFAAWGARDPIGVYEEWLVRSGRLADTGRPGRISAAARRRLAEVEASVGAEVEAAAEQALARRGAGQPDPARVSVGVYAE
jgi:TPP-dependent pyruvate/acetoin dehydrogenase alpha subunit